MPGGNELVIFGDWIHRLVFSLASVSSDIPLLLPYVFIILVHITFILFYVVLFLFFDDLELYDLYRYFILHLLFLFL